MRDVVFLFSGIGDHYPGMAEGLYAAEPVFRREFDACAGLVADRVGFDLREVIFETGARVAPERLFDIDPTKGFFSVSLADSGLGRTLVAQPLLFGLQWAAARLLESYGVRADAMAGYSIGEYVAACCAGVMSLEAALEAVVERARLIEELPRGGMLVVAAPPRWVVPRLGPGTYLAVEGSPTMTVVGGKPPAVGELAERLAGENVVSIRFPAEHAFHTPLMAEAGHGLRSVLDRTRLHAPAIPTLSNVTGTWLTADEAVDPAYWAEHLQRPVRFIRGAAQLWRLRDPVFVTLGPGQGLIGLVLQNKPGSPEVKASEVKASEVKASMVQVIRGRMETKADAAFFEDALTALADAGVIDRQRQAGGTFS